MKSPTKTPRRQEQLNNRLLSYSVMAGAVLAHSAAHAAVQKTTPNYSLTYPFDVYEIKFNGEENPKFGIVLQTYTSTHSSTSSNSLGIYGLTSKAGFIVVGPYVRALNAGFTVNSTQYFVSNTGWPGDLAGYSNIYGFGGGLFRGQTGKYIGIRFQLEDFTIHYGWIQLDVSNLDVTSAVVNTIAWEDTPNLGIITGSDVSLPVQATPVVAESTIKGVVLQWATESEVDHLGFVIERRIAGSDGEWQTISSYETNPRLKGQGNSSSHKAYQFTDVEAESGTEYEYKVAAVDFNGKISSEQIIRVQHTVSLPTELALLQNYPNPFNPATTIQFDLPEETHVKLNIYNVAGQVVDVLVDHKMAAGKHIEKLDASNYSAGLYFYELLAGDQRMVKKMHLIK